MAAGAHLSPTAADLQRLRRVAIGREEADLVIADVQLLCLQSREVLRRNVVISGAFIAAVTPVEHHNRARHTIAGDGGR